jgi:SH3-like domain-containing protein
MKTILSIDPGKVNMGYGIIQQKAGKYRIIKRGMIKNTIQDLKAYNLKDTVLRFHQEIEDMIDIKGQAEFIRKKAYYTEVNADNPQALAEGIVLSTGNTVTSKGKLIPGKVSVKQIQVPEDYGVKFNYMAIANRVYRFNYMAIANRVYRDIAKRYKRIASQIYVEK